MFELLACCRAATVETPPAEVRFAREDLFVIGCLEMDCR